MTETLADFDESIRRLLEEEQEPRYLEEAILNIVSSIDNPGSPAGEAIGTFMQSLHGRTPEQRQTFRKRMLGVTLADLQRVAKTWLIDDKAHIAVISDPKTLEKHSELGLTIHSI